MENYLYLRVTMEVNWVLEMRKIKNKLILLMKDEKLKINSLFIFPFFLFTKKNEELFVFRSNYYGQLGLGYVRNQIFPFVLLMKNEFISTFNFW